MNPIWYIVAIAVSVAILSLVQAIRLRKISSRQCQGRAWKSVFPDCTNQEIRDFLQIFLDSFIVPQRLKLRLSPDDRPYDIYKIMSAGVDSFEYENFTEALQKRFGRGLPETMDQSWTLGDIFRHTRSNQ
jgi:hypothetical protein